MKVRLPLWGKPQGYATLETEATKGATVGENLYWPGGSLVAVADFNPPAAEPGPHDSVSRTLWSLVIDIPPNVLAVAALSTSGYVRRDGDTWTADDAPMAARIIQRC